MFYLYKGSVCVTPVGRTIPQYKELKLWCRKSDAGKKLFSDICMYIFFVYHKVDSLGNKNAFNPYPINERREVVCEKYELFKKTKKPGTNSRFYYKNVYTETPCMKFLEFYKSACYTEAERTLDAFREKISYWRDKYAIVSNSADDDKEFAMALALAEKHYKEYETKVLLETSTDEEGVEGCPLFLFEIPENQKPMHIQLQYGDLKKIN